MVGGRVKAGEPVRDAYNRSGKQQRWLKAGAVGEQYMGLRNGLEEDPTECANGVDVGGERGGRMKNNS